MVDDVKKLILRFAGVYHDLDAFLHEWHWIIGDYTWTSWHLGYPLWHAIKKEERQLHSLDRLIRKSVRPCMCLRVLHKECLRRHMQLFYQGMESDTENFWELDYVVAPLRGVRLSQLPTTLYRTPVDYPSTTTDEALPNFE